MVMRAGAALGEFRCAQAPDTGTLIRQGLYNAVVAILHQPNSMTYAQLLEALQTSTGYALLCGNADGTLIAAEAGRHPDAFLGEIASMMYSWCALTNIHASVERAAVVNALGPLRRRFMAGEGSAADFRRLNHIIEAIDAAFDAAVQAGRRR